MPLTKSFDCVLGIDNALRVAYNRTVRTERGPPRNFSELLKTTTYTVTTTVTNDHPFDVSALVVRDSVPLGDETAGIKVVLRKPEGLARATSGEDVAVALGEDDGSATIKWSRGDAGQEGEKHGMYEWLCEVPAGKRIQLMAEWDVKALDDLSWDETVIQVPKV